MKNFSIVSILCFSMLFAGVSAQEPSAEELQRQFESELRRLQSPRAQLGLEANYLASYHRNWTGHGTAGFLSNYILRRSDDMSDRRVLSGDAELGLTEEQKQRLLFPDHETRGEWYRQQNWQSIPEVRQATVAFNATRLSDDPLFEHATEEQKNAYREQWLQKCQVITYSYRGNS